MKPGYYKTGDIADKCGVTRITVVRWIAKGLLIAYRLPGGHYRIKVEEFEKFAKAYGIPVPEK